jgi:hypothetical protein
MTSERDLRSASITSISALRPLIRTRPTVSTAAGIMSSRQAATTCRATRSRWALPKVPAFRLAQNAPDPSSRVPFGLRRGRRLSRPNGRGRMLRRVAMLNPGRAMFELRPPAAQRPFDPHRTARRLIETGEVNGLGQSPTSERGLAPPAPARGAQPAAENGRIPGPQRRDRRAESGFAEDVLAERGELSPNLSGLFSDGHEPREKAVDVARRMASPNKHAGCFEISDSRSSRERFRPSLISTEIGQAITSPAQHLRQTSPRRIIR